MKPRAHIIIINIGARRKSVSLGMRKGISSIWLWNGEHVFVTYTLSRVVLSWTVADIRSLPSPAPRRSHCSGPPIIWNPTICCGFFRTGIGSFYRRQYFETSGSKSRFHPRTGHDGSERE
jgi:hypothetical protein